MSRIFLIGRLGQDPELRQGKTGTPWCTLGVATNRSRKEGDAWIDETDWHDVKVFGTEAEKCHRLGRKGAVIAVDGSLVYETWQDEQGNRKKRARVIANRVQFVADYRRPDEVPAPGPGIASEPAETTLESTIPF